MAFDFKKEYREYYLPGNAPEIVTVPPANYIAVRGQGDPNEEGGAYQAAIGVLYAVAYTLKMSYKTPHRIEGFYEYVVPPLEGFWWQEGVAGVDYADKSSFHWISVIRLPDFVTEEDFLWAVETAEKKKKLDCSGAEFLTLEEGLCVQIMHVGAYGPVSGGKRLRERLERHAAAPRDLPVRRAENAPGETQDRDPPPDPKGMRKWLPQRDTWTTCSSSSHPSRGSRPAR